MQPVHKLALHAGLLGALMCLGFFFHVIAFVAVLALFVYKLDEFRFVYLNTQGVAHDKYYQPVIPGLEYSGTIVGSDGSGSVRENLPEGEE